mgnify:CR=1 FL=1|jgi:hypothetical protein
MEVTQKSVVSQNLLLPEGRGIDDTIGFLVDPNEDTTDLFPPTENKNSQRLFS